MKSTKKVRKEHARKYIETVFASSLESAGFVCPDDNLLCWYRKRSDEVFNSIIFRSNWPQLPLFLDINYGIIPAFEMPMHISNVVHNVRFDSDEELFTFQPIVENCSNGGTQARFSDDIWVYAPLQDGRGKYTFDEILLPAMDRIQTIEETYCFHKDRRANKRMKDGPYDALSRTFVNMAIWVDDKEIYPLAKQKADEAVVLYQKLSAGFPQKQDHAQKYAMWKQLQEVLISGEYDRYREELSARMRKNNELFQSKFI